MEGFVKLHTSGKYLKVVNAIGFSSGEKLVLVDLNQATLFGHSFLKLCKLTDADKKLFEQCLEIKAVESRTVTLITSNSDS